MNWIYKWLPIIFGCHQRSDRSFFYKGKQFPICARCTGELVGIITGIFTYIFYPTDWSVIIIVMIPMIADGFIQRLTKYESTNIRRLITGILFGYGFYSIIAKTTVMAFMYGVNTGRGFLM